jgi:hypothetical protein
MDGSPSERRAGIAQIELYVSKLYIDMGDQGSPT